MKNIQVIDGAINCEYAIYSCIEEDFELIFPNYQDIEFIEDFFERVGEDIAVAVTSRLWDHKCNKKTVNGIHGTLFYQLKEKKPHYPNKKER